MTAARVFSDGRCGLDSALLTVVVETRAMRTTFWLVSDFGVLGLGTDIAMPRLTRLWVDVDGVIGFCRAERAVSAKNEASHAQR